MEPAQHLGVRPEAEIREVEESKRVVVTQIEEEVGRPFVISVLEELDQWKAEEPLVEADCPLYVGADQCQMMDAARRRGRALLRFREVGRAQALPLCGGCLEIDGHEPSRC